MGMFDSFYLKVKCPHCGNVDVIEFQTKDFDCNLNTWREGDVFDAMKIEKGMIENVYGGCRVKNNPSCGREWEKVENPNFHGFGRPVYCDVLIEDYKVKCAINVRKELEKEE